MPEPIKCAVYARVSTDQQGDSIENQVSQCKEYIARLGPSYDGAEIMIYQDEAVSGYYTSVFDRAEMQRAIRDAKANAFKLLVFKEVSRVGRDKQENPAIIGMFEQYGVRVVAINDNYDSLNKDNITFDILSVLSEQESKKISSRVSSARRQKAKRGQWSGEAPIGYRVNPETKTLEADEGYRRIPELVFEWYVRLGLGTFKVAERLNQDGYRTRAGRPWTRESVNRILRNPAYIGQVVYGTRRNQLLRAYDDGGKMTKRKVQARIDKREWQIVEHAHEALIDEELFARAQAILAARGHHRVPRRAYHPLTGILVCGSCGERMVCQRRTFRLKAYRYYICKTYHKYGRLACSQRNINAEEIEALLIDRIRRKLASLPSDFFLIRMDSAADLVRLHQEMLVQEQAQAKWKKDQMDLFRQRELFVFDTYQQEMQRMKRRIEAAAEALTRLRGQREEILKQGEETTAFAHLAEEAARLQMADLAEVRALLQEAVQSVKVTGNRLEIQYRVDFELDWA
ncbi:recombinase family protein [Cohnella nanjingensis]|uniref:Recombinase family protein n=1 Tax=Cohnella nanjingensis TaxID=1387779 RepID=A0A7X0VDV1_9BACL|nr:recombinase family protein [Cohnella nanjingensis]MBB6669608.1 recombinase family protein [Cohnella nanjingensis]